LKGEKGKKKEKKNTGFLSFLQMMMRSLGSGFGFFLFYKGRSYTKEGNKKEWRGTFPFPFFSWEKSSLFHFGIRKRESVAPLNSIEEGGGGEGRNSERTSLLIGSAQRGEEIGGREQIIIKNQTLLPTGSRRGGGRLKMSQKGRDVHLGGRGFP